MGAPVAAIPNRELFCIYRAQTIKLASKISISRKRHLHSYNIRHKRQAGDQFVAEREVRRAGVIVDAEQQMSCRSNRLEMVKKLPVLSAFDTTSVLVVDHQVPQQDE